MDAKIIFTIAILLFVSIAIVIALGMTRQSLASAITGGAPWSLADALSEEANITQLDIHNLPIRDASGNPVTASVLRASSSRVIAFIGLVAILVMYIGVGLILLRDFSMTDSIPDSTADALKFLAAGTTLFIPYVANKASSLLDWLSPSK